LSDFGIFFQSIIIEINITEDGILTIPPPGPRTRWKEGPRFLFPKKRVRNHLRRVALFFFAASGKRHRRPSLKIPNL